MWRGCYRPKATLWQRRLQTPNVTGPLTSLGMLRLLSTAPYHRDIVYAVEQGPVARTFLIADLRGYTSYTFTRGDEAAARLAGLFADLAEVVATECGGTLLELRGDEALLAFVSARQALAAAVALQGRWAGEGISAPQVGIGLDAGEAVPVRGGFRGTALNLAARLCSLAQGGEVLASEAVIHLAGHVDGLAYADRGSVRVKGVPREVQVWQVVAEGESLERPPLQTPTVSTLPPEPTPFVGREREVAAIIELLDNPGVRWLTLVGPGGAGKTRLAQRVAASLLPAFPDGVFFVPLAAVADPALVLSTVAHSLGVVEDSGSSLSEQLRAHMAGKRLLVLIDNLEHLRDAAPALGELLAASPGPTFLVTSRSVLRQYGEHVFEVPPLSLPERTGDPAALASSDSVALFVERARAARGSFDLTPGNAAAVATICRRLDGLPLAIELAAARTRILPPPALSTRLDHPLRLLAGGDSGRPERHQTLRATIEWSYGLLEDDQRQLLALLSVFAGGCTIEAVATVCGDDEGDPLEGLVPLVENSLVRQVGEDQPRFVMLETIREYAAEQLPPDTAQAAGAAHATYFRSLCLEAEPAIRGPEQKVWLERLEAEHDNLRSALAWLIAHGNADAAVQMVAALWRFWWIKGYWSEGARWIETALALPGASAGRAGAISGLANLTLSQGDLERAEALHRQALELRRESGDQVGVALSLNNLAVITEQRGDFPGAANVYEEALAVARGAGDPWTAALILGNLGGVLGNQGMYDRAAELGEDSRRLWRQLGDRGGEGRVINNLVTIALARGDLQRAAELQRESLQIYRELGNQENIPYSLEMAAKILTAVEHNAEAARLFAAAGALRQVLGQPLSPVDEVEIAEFTARLRDALGEAAQVYAAEGAALTDPVGVALDELAALSS
jgi:predicted ATPase/class 3 adenylate cyclase/Tfp pilus assembly protein PilF